MSTMKSGSDYTQKDVHNNLFNFKKVKDEIAWREYARSKQRFPKPNKETLRLNTILPATKKNVDYRLYREGKEVYQKKNDAPPLINLTAFRSDQVVSIEEFAGKSGITTDKYFDILVHVDKGAHNVTLLDARVLSLTSLPETTWDEKNKIGNAWFPFPQFLHYPTLLVELYNYFFAMFMWDSDAENILHNIVDGKYVLPRGQMLSCLRVMFADKSINPFPLVCEDRSELLEKLSGYPEAIQFVHDNNAERPIASMNITQPILTPHGKYEANDIVTGKPFKYNVGFSKQLIDEMVVLRDREHAAEYGIII